MKVLVTGGAGFLGSHLADALTRAGHAVTVFDRAPSRYLSNGQTERVGDITDADAVAEALAGVDAVYHLAALGDLNAAKSRPVETVQVNIGGTLNVLEGCRAQGVGRLMFASSVYVYSREGSFYRCSKQACESYIEEYGQQYGLKSTVLRYGSLYGPRSDDSNGLLRLLRRAVEDSALTYDGSPENLRQYIHVEDAAELSVRALDDAYVGEQLILTGHESLRMRDLFQMFSEILGKPVDVEYGDDGTSDDRSMRGHYQTTPYAYTPKPGRKLSANPYTDFGQGLLQLVESLNQSHDT